MEKRTRYKQIQRHAKTWKKAKCFTLVELLVVVAVIVILLGLLLPALSHVRGKARQAICMGSLKQWSYASLSYLQESDERFPFGRNNSFSPYRQWYDYLAPYVNLEDTANPGYMKNRLKNNTLKNCPVKYDTGSSDYYGSSAPDRSSNIVFLQYPDYLANAGLFPYYDGSGIVGGSEVAGRLSQIAKASKTLEFVDGGGWGGMILRQEVMDPTYAYCGVAYFRHPLGANVLFLDGHLTWMKMPITANDIACRGSLNGQLW